MGGGVHAGILLRPLSVLNTQMRMESRLSLLLGEVPHQNPCYGRLVYPYTQTQKVGNIVHVFHE